MIKTAKSDMETLLPGAGLGVKVGEQNDSEIFAGFRECLFRSKFFYRPWVIRRSKVMFF